MTIDLTVLNYEDAVAFIASGYASHETWVVTIPRLPWREWPDLLDVPDFDVYLDPARRVSVGDTAIDLILYANADNWDQASRVLLPLASRPFGGVILVPKATATPALMARVFHGEGAELITEDGPDVLLVRDPETTPVNHVELPRLFADAISVLDPAAGAQLRAATTPAE